jgi:hypothetical protein
VCYPLRQDAFFAASCRKHIKPVWYYAAIAASCRALPPRVLWACGLCRKSWRRKTRLAAKGSTLAASVRSTRGKTWRQKPLDAAWVGGECAACIRGVGFPVSGRSLQKIIGLSTSIMWNGPLWYILSEFERREVRVLDRDSINVILHSKNKSTRGVLWRCKVPLGAILVPWPN